MTSLEQALGDAPRVAVDTAPLIYYLEDHPRYREALQRVFGRAARGEIELVFSTIALAEILVRPFQIGRWDVARRYCEILTGSPQAQLVPVDATVAGLPDERRSAEAGGRSAGARAPGPAVAARPRPPRRARGPREAG